MSEIKITGEKRLVIVSGRAHPQLAVDVAAELGADLVHTDARTFANGEIYARYDESVRGCDAFVIQSHTSPINEWLMEQLIMVDALKRASAKRITVVSPFYPYARQDKKGRGREPISARLVADLYKAYGLTLCLTFAMSMGSRLVLFPRFDPDLVLPVIKKHPPTFLPAVPPIYERLTKAADEKGVSLQGITIAISGAMPLSAAVVEPWEARTGGTLVEGYGLSETSPVLMANPVGPTRRAGTVGLPLPGTEIRVVDPEKPTEERPVGEEGELVVRGPQVFSGYWKKPAETEAVFVEATDGGADWYRTGDIVTMDADGFVTIVDRIKELIITGGFNVAPSEVEEVVRRHPSVADVAVIGLPSEHSGEDVVAAVVLEPGAELDEEGIRALARENLTPYKVPRRVIAVDELPKSLIGKVLRKKVRDSLLQA